MTYAAVYIAHRPLIPTTTTIAGGIRPSFSVDTTPPRVSAEFTTSLHPVMERSGGHPCRVLRVSAIVIFETYIADRVDLIASAISLMKLYLRVPYSDSKYLMEFVLV